MHVLHSGAVCFMVMMRVSPTSVLRVTVLVRGTCLLWEQANINRVMAGNQINFLIACNSVIYTIGLTIELPHGIISSNNVHGRNF